MCKWENVQMCKWENVKMGGKGRRVAGWGGAVAGEKRGVWVRNEEVWVGGGWG